jgi:DNA polymerase III alpha subunit
MSLDAAWQRSKQRAAGDFCKKADQRHAEKWITSSNMRKEFLSNWKDLAAMVFHESHAASFALLVYVSAWIKCYYPDVFGCALLNSMPWVFTACSNCN